MAENLDLIRNEIEHTRERLGEDLSELEQVAKQETDWRVHFARHRWAYIGAAFGVAALAGRVARKVLPFRPTFALMAAFATSRIFGVER